MQSTKYLQKEKSRFNQLAVDLPETVQRAKQRRCNSHHAGSGITMLCKKEKMKEGFSTRLLLKLATNESPVRAL